MDSVSIINKGSKDLINEIKTGNIDIGLIGSLKPIKEDKLMSKVIKIDNYRIIVSKTILSLSLIKYHSNNLKCSIHFT